MLCDVRNSIQPTWKIPVWRLQIQAQAIEWQTKKGNPRLKEETTMTTTAKATHFIPMYSSVSSIEDTCQFGVVAKLPKYFLISSPSFEPSHLSSERWRECDFVNALSPKKALNYGIYVCRRFAWFPFPTFVYCTWCYLENVPFLAFLCKSLHLNPIRVWFH